MTTVIENEKVKYKGFSIEFHFPHYYVYQDGGRKALWLDMGISDCKRWIDSLMNWMEE